MCLVNWKECLHYNHSYVSSLQNLASTLVLYFLSKSTVMRRQHHYNLVVQRSLQATGFFMPLSHQELPNFQIIKYSAFFFTCYALLKKTKSNPLATLFHSYQFPSPSPPIYWHVSILLQPSCIKIMIYKCLLGDLWLIWLYYRYIMSIANMKQISSTKVVL